MKTQIEGKKETSKQKIKCVVWDLDHTIWKGILMEDSDIVIKDQVLNVIRTLDQRGILQSVASRNEFDIAMKKLEELGIDEYFLYPQINWGSKSTSIQKIADLINIGLDTIAFIDDQQFEREEVQYHHPNVLCVDASQVELILDMPEFNPKFITEDSKHRRQLYMNDITRNQLEENFEGTQTEFLASLGMVFTIAPVQGNDLKRAEELTVRTNQLNATGYTYSYEELDGFRTSQRHLLLGSELQDKYGTYGKIGLTLLECSEEVWTLKLLLMSCRVMSRGVGSVMLNYIANIAKNAGVTLRAEFVPTDRNRMMLLTYKFAGFTEVDTQEGLIIFEHDPSQVQPIPDYITLITKNNE